MKLLPGYRLAVAPRFHIDADWPTRLRLGAGTEVGDDGFFPRGPWREPTADELAALVAAPPPGVLPVIGEPTAVPAPSPDDHVLLFQIPEHLRAAWWRRVDAAAETGGPIPGFEEFAAEVAEFLAFKRLDTAGSARMEAVVTEAGARSIRVDPDTGRPSGLGPRIAPWLAWPTGDRPTLPRLHAVVNLADEATGVVIVNLTPAGLAAELDRRRLAVPATVGESIATFLHTCPDHPPLRVRLAPGEGCRLPAGGLILDADATGHEEPGVMLLISEDGRAGV